MHQEHHPNKARLAEMVVSAQSGSNAAQHNLVALAENFKNNLVANLGRRHHLTKNDIEDAQQEGVFWILEAIQHYDAGPTSREAGASFFTFAHRVISFRVKDYLRRHRRAERREPIACGEIVSLRIVDRHGSWQSMDVELAGPESDDPVHVAESHESTDRLNEALSKLGEDSRELWDLLASRMRLGPIAVHLGISYEAVRRRRRRLLAELKSQLEER